jgi:hypothetical protein
MYYIWNITVSPLLGLPQASGLQSFLIVALIIMVRGANTKATKQGA